MLLSILIPTLQRRRNQFTILYERLQEQIQVNNLQPHVEIVSLADGGELSIGEKRNNLLDQATGAYVAFVDDDDLVSDNYVQLICENLHRNPDVDCLGIRGVITFRGTHPCQFVHSVRYRSIFSRDHTYYRPPAHLNPIRRDIARRYRFADVSYSEDFDWALRIRNDGALKREAFIDSPIYFYRSRRWWPYQLMLDHTEGLRHKLGITMVNRLQQPNRASYGEGHASGGE